MHITKTKSAVAGVALVASAGLAAAAVPGAAVETSNRGTHTHARLNALNNSGAFGNAHVKSQARRLHIEVNAHGLAKGLPHAQHIHWGKQARNECPTVGKNDANNDFRLETGEGVPAYGPIAVSLTKRGDTSPDSGLAVDRFPTAPRGHVHYDRDTKTNKQVARAIRRGDAVVVIHGVDYNGNGTYDFSAGKSDLDPSLPSEATDPAVCGVLHH